MFLTREEYDRPHIVPTPVMSEQRRKDLVVAVRSLIKRLLVHERERKKERESLAKEQEE